MSTLRRTVGGAWILLHTRGQQRHCSNVSGFLRVYLGTVRGKLFGRGKRDRRSRKLLIMPSSTQNQCGH
jgi:hypothetical protein